MSLSCWRPENNIEYPWCLCFSSPSVRGRVKGTVFFFFILLGTKQNCRDKQTLPCKVKTQHLGCVLTYWFSLAAIGRRSKEDGDVYVGPRELSEMQAALCTPREWGLAYIECLCCRIESVEHLCLNSLTVKLGLTKIPLTQTENDPELFLFIFCIKSFSCGYFWKIHSFFFVLLDLSALHETIQINVCMEEIRKQRE